MQVIKEVNYEAGDERIEEGVVLTHSSIDND